MKYWQHLKDEDEDDEKKLLYLFVFNGVSLTGSKDLKEKRNRNDRKSMRHFRSPLKGSEFKMKDVTLLKRFFFMLFNFFLSIISKVKFIEYQRETEI